MLTENINKNLMMIDKFTFLDIVYMYINVIVVAICVVIYLYVYVNKCCVSIPTLYTYICFNPYVFV